MKQERSWEGTALAEEPGAEASEDLGWLMRLGWLALLILGLGFGGWAFAARLSQAVVAPGWVVRDMAAHVVQHPDGRHVGRACRPAGDAGGQGRALGPV